jgi:hypothetical protein
MSALIRAREREGESAYFDTGAACFQATPLAGDCPKRQDLRMARHCVYFAL